MQINKNVSAEADCMASDIPTIVDLRKYIATTFYGERPHIRGRRVLVSMIAANARENDWSAARLAHEFTLSEAEVLAALLYYDEHKADIDRQDEEEQRLFDEMYERSRKDAPK
jgi:uncharacterized protein (DUF433 family)